MADQPAAAAGGAASIFKQKLGGIPVWVYLAALGAGAAVVIWYTNRNSQKTAAQAAASGTNGANAGNASSLYPVAPVTYVTGIPTSTGAPSGAPSGSPSTPGGVPDTPINAGDWNSLPGYVGMVYGKGTFTQGGQTYFHLDNPNAAQAYMNGGGQTYYFPEAGVAVPNAPTGSVMYGRVPAVASNSAGGLGGAMVAGGMGGASPWQQMNQQHRVPHYWAGMGGQGGSLSDAAKQTGMPLERLLHLNPRHRAGNLVRIG